MNLLLRCRCASFPQTLERTHTFYECKAPNLPLYSVRFGEVFVAAVACSGVMQPSINSPINFAAIIIFFRNRSCNYKLIERSQCTILSNHCSIPSPSIRKKESLHPPLFSRHNLTPLHSRKAPTQLTHPSALQF